MEKYKILLLDDDCVTRSYEIAIRLTKQNNEGIPFEIVRDENLTAENLRQLKTADLVIIGPGADDERVPYLQEAKRLGVPTIILSGHNSYWEREASRIGAAFLPKPFGILEFQDTVFRMVRIRRGKGAEMVTSLAS